MKQSYDSFKDFFNDFLDDFYSKGHANKEGNITIVSTKRTIYFKQYFTFKEGTITANKVNHSSSYLLIRATYNNNSQKTTLTLISTPEDRDKALTSAIPNQSQLSSLSEDAAFIEYCNQQNAIRDNSETREELRLYPVDNSNDASKDISSLLTRTDYIVFSNLSVSAPIKQNLPSEQSTPLHAYSDLHSDSVYLLDEFAKIGKRTSELYALYSLFLFWKNQASGHRNLLGQNNFPPLLSIILEQSELPAHREIRKSLWNSCIMEATEAVSDNRFHNEYSSSFSKTFLRLLKEQPFFRSIVDEDIVKIRIFLSEIDISQQETVLVAIAEEPHLKLAPLIYYTLLQSGTFSANSLLHATIEFMQDLTFGDKERSLLAREGIRCLLKHPQLFNGYGKLQHILQVLIKPDFSLLINREFIYDLTVKLSLKYLDANLPSIPQILNMAMRWANCPSEINNNITKDIDDPEYRNITWEEQRNAARDRENLSPSIHSTLFTISVRPRKPFSEDFFQGKIPDANQITAIIAMIKTHAQTLKQKFETYNSKKTSWSAKDTNNAIRDIIHLATSILSSSVNIDCLNFFHALSQEVVRLSQKLEQNKQHQKIRHERYDICKEFIDNMQELFSSNPSLKYQAD